MRQFASPFLFARHAFDDGEVGFFHPARFKHLAHRAHRALAFGEEHHAARVRIQPVNVPEIAQIARARPEIIRADGRINRRLQVPVRLAPRIRHEHPAARLVNRDDRAVLKDDGDRLAARQFDEIGFRHFAKFNGMGIRPQSLL